MLSAVVGLLFVAACTKRETPVAAGLRTQTLILGNSREPGDLDPHVVFGAVTEVRILTALFEGLTAIDAKSTKAVPAAAERWDVSSDGLAYTFHLRPGLRWSNGDPLTAEDFRFSIERILTPQFAAFYASNLFALKNAEAFLRGRVRDFAAVGVRCVDARTLRIDLERPTVYLPELAAGCTWLPVHRATLEKFGAVAKQGTKWTRPGNFIGNGPFVLTEWSPQSRLVVSKNANYWAADQLRLNRIVFLPIEKAEVEENNFRTGQQHVTWEMPLAKVATYRAQAASSLRIDPLLGTWYVNFNVTNALLADQRVRRALALAIDREALSRVVLNGTGPAATSLTTPNCGGYTARAHIGHDPAEARRLLAAAGYPKGKGLPKLPLLVRSETWWPRLAEAIQSMWQRELGVQTAIEIMEFHTVHEIQQQKRHTIALWGWIGDFADPATFLELFCGDGGNNWTGWSNPEYDRLIAEAADTVDPARRFESFQKAEVLLLEAAPITPFLHASRVFLRHPAVKGWAPSVLGWPRYQLVSLEAEP